MRKVGALALVFIFVLAGLWPISVALAQSEEAPAEEPEYLDGFPIWEELVAQQSGTSSRYLAATGEHCYVYVDGGNPSQSEIDDLVDEFDNVIWPADTEIFGTISRDRIDIHIDTIDGPYGIGGYYIPGTWSIYIDAADLSIWGYEITAHEFQHLIHDKHDNNEELWLNEGMSDLAIHMIYGPEALSVAGHLNSFEDNPDNDLTVFENEMYDYGSAYAFALYLWEHFGGNATIRDIVDNSGNGFTGVLQVLGTVNSSYTYSDIELFSMWSVANLLDDTKVYDGLYGYETIDISMYIEGEVKDYPTSFQSHVESWANDYYVFREGEKSDLAVEASRIDGTFNCTLIGIGSAGTLVRSVLITKNEPVKEVVIPRFGSHYMIAYMTISGWEGERYRFSAEFKDSTPPTTVVAVDPGSPDGLNGYYVTLPTIGFITSEPADIFFWWDDDPDQTQYCPDCTPVIAPVTPQGNHTLYFYSVDRDGNVEEKVKERMFLVDTVMPNTFSNITPLNPDGENGWYVSNVSITLTSEDDAIIFYRWDSGFFHNYTGKLYAMEGAHELYFYSVDIAGNEGETYQRDIKLDTVAPALNMDVYPLEPNGKNGFYTTPPTVAVTVDEADAYVYYNFDGATNIVYSAPFKVPQGQHFVSLWSRDGAGNEGEVVTLDFKVDSIVPVTEMEISPSSPDGDNGWYLTYPTVKLKTDPDASVYYRLDDGPERRFTGSIGVEEGSHNLYYWSKDRAGNVEPEQHLDIKVDTETPETVIDVKGAEIFGWYLDPPMIIFDVSETATTFYRWDDGIGTKYTIPIPGKDGKHELHFHSVDEAGNTEEEQVHSLQVDTGDPAVYFTVTPTFVFEGDELVFDASSSFDNLGIEVYEFDFGDGAIERSSDDARFSHTYHLAGTYSVTLKVVDEAGREATMTKEILVEKVERPSEEELPLSMEMLIIGAIILLVLIAAAGLAVARNRRKKALARYVEIYEARMAEERRRRRIRRKKVKKRPRGKKVRKKKRKKG